MATFVASEIKSTCCRLLKDHVYTTQSFLHLYLYFTVETIVEIIEQYVTVMFKLPILEGRSPRSPLRRDEIECQCPHSGNGQYNVTLIGKDFTCGGHGRSRHQLIQDYWFHRYWCSRCGKEHLNINFYPFCRDILTREWHENEELTVRLLQFESRAIRPFVLHYVRRQFENLLKDFLIADLVEIVVLYLYIETYDNEQDVQPQLKKRKIA